MEVDGNLKNEPLTIFCADEQANFIESVSYLIAIEAQQRGQAADEQDKFL